ncbi:hypothetical protein JCM3765_002397 [Sporobolomyces pararoseus]
MESFGDLNIFRLPTSDRIEPFTRAIKSEEQEDGTETPLENSDAHAELQEVKEEDEKPLIPTVPELRTIDFMYDIDDTTQETHPTEPHTTKFPDFPPLPFKRRAPHPLVRDTWFDSSLSLPPPSHLHTLDDGNSLFDVNFSRSPKNDIGGSNVAMISIRDRNICCTGWHMPADRAEGGGPYYILASGAWKIDWKKIRKIAELGTPEGYAKAVANNKRSDPPVEVCDGSVSLFYGGGKRHTNTWRYRGDVKVHEQIDILPSDFAAMKKEEKQQWIDYFRFENVVRRLNGFTTDSKGKMGRGMSPAELFESLCKPDSEKLVLTILRVVDWNEERINRWMKARRTRLEGEEDVKPVLRSPSSTETEDEEEETKPLPSISTRSRSTAPTPAPRDEKPALEVARPFKRPKRKH